MNTTNKNTDKQHSISKKTQKMTKRVGSTSYDVYIHFSETSKETLSDKIMRLIRNDIQSKR